MKNLIDGKVSSILTSFVAPITLAALYNQFFQLVDVFIAGKFAGTRALAVVTQGYLVNLIVQTIIMGITTGMSIVIAQYLGKGDFHSMKKGMHSGYAICVITFIALTVISFILAPYFLQAMNAPKDIYKDSLLYIRFYSLSMVSCSLYHAFSNGVLKAIGDGKASLQLMVTTITIDIFLDILFVIILKLPVSYLGLAAVISQTAGLILCLIMMHFKDEALSANPFGLVYDKVLVKKILSYGGLASLAQIITVIIMTVLQGLINKFGSITAGGYGAAVRVELFIQIPMLQIGIAAASFTAQNLGAGKLDRVNKGIRFCQLLSIIFAFISAVLLMFFSPQIMSIFTSDPRQIEVGSAYLRVTSIGYIPLAVHLILAGAMRGAGLLVYPLISIAFNSLLIRLAFSVAFISKAGPLAVYYASTISYFAAAIITTFFFLRATWKNPKSKFSAKLHKADFS